ncbi:MAG TPA: ATP-binding cassette domain-containing protein [Hydrogenophaga sp.]|uniref:ATP-binding cassette domain-containing protein n=1 Tax=Hydrogenophaga sp. TaxID=1904254 RepID=UPI002C948446|nr:ATP-binding cassette domain-containing protein [Hydrogenophaga sp.]HMN94712.1 ATP-binding cassette domain-containing protein [Hydrogenophaga sp.]HMP08924.1 ATP-binding cassette domain-containing protein [Hydrogenophaga sp.]
MSLNIHIRRLGSPQRTLVSDLTLEVPPGQVLTLMGPSGCGKSSVLAAIAGTLGTVAEGQSALGFEGQVLLDGHDVSRLPTARRGIGLIFQDDLLFAHLSVIENLLFAVPPGPTEARKNQAGQALAEAGLAGYGDRDPATLSGGQRARVALMRALLARPRALLLDEPFSRLDAALRAQFRAFVFDHIRAANIPAILVTHDHADIADPSRVMELTHAG